MIQTTNDLDLFVNIHAYQLIDEINQYNNQLYIDRGLDMVYVGIKSGDKETLNI